MDTSGGLSARSGTSDLPGVWGAPGRPVSVEDLWHLVREQHTEVASLRSQLREAKEQVKDKDATISFLKTRIATLQNRLQAVSGGAGGAAGSPAVSTSVAVEAAPAAPILQEPQQQRRHELPARLSVGSADEALSLARPRTPQSSRGRQAAQREESPEPTPTVASSSSTTMAPVMSARGAAAAVGEAASDRLRPKRLSLADTPVTAGVVEKPVVSGSGGGGGGEASIEERRAVALQLEDQMRRELAMLRASSFGSGGPEDVEEAYLDEAASTVASGQGPLACSRPTSPQSPAPQVSSAACGHAATTGSIGSPGPSAACGNTASPGNIGSPGSSTRRASSAAGSRPAAAQAPQVPRSPATLQRSVGGVGIAAANETCSATAAAATAPAPGRDEQRAGRQVLVASRSGGALLQVGGTAPQGELQRSAMVRQQQQQQRLHRQLEAKRRPQSGASSSTTASAATSSVRDSQSSSSSSNAATARRFGHNAGSMSVASAPAVTEAQQQRFSRVAGNASPPTPKLSSRSAALAPPEHPLHPQLVAASAPGSARGPAAAAATMACVAAASAAVAAVSSRGSEGGGAVGSAAAVPTASSGGGSGSASVPVGGAGSPPLQSRLQALRPSFVAAPPTAAQGCSSPSVPQSPPQLHAQPASLNDRFKSLRDEKKRQRSSLSGVPTLGSPPHGIQHPTVGPPSALLGPTLASLSGGSCGGGGGAWASARSSVTEGAALPHPSPRLSGGGGGPTSGLVAEASGSTSTVAAIAAVAAALEQPPRWRDPAPEGASGPASAAVAKSLGTAGFSDLAAVRLAATRPGSTV